MADSTVGTPVRSSGPSLCPGPVLLLPMISGNSEEPCENKRPGRFRTSPDTCEGPAFVQQLLPMVRDLFIFPFLEECFQVLLFPRSEIFR